MTVRSTRLLGAALAIALAPAPLLAQDLVVVAVDRKVELVNGAARTTPNAGPDSLAIVDLAANPPRVTATIPNVPTSVVGPPSSAAIAPNGRLALVTANSRLDPADSSRQIPDNRMSVVDLAANPPRVVGTVTTGAGPAGVAITPAGDLALVANRNDGTVSVFAIAGATLTPVSTLRVGPEASGPSGVAISADGRRALVTRDGDSRLTLLAIEGANVTLANRDMHAGLRPYGVDMTRDGRVAVVANIGMGNGDNDTVSVIDMTLNPPRVVETVTVGQTPEGVAMSPDGRFVAFVVMHGSNRAENSPFYSARGVLRVFRLDGPRLVHVADGLIGRWSQGAVFSRDGSRIMVGNMVEKNAQIFAFDGTRLTDTGTTLAFEGGPASFSLRSSGR